MGRKGRSGDFTSETILRALIVHAIEGLSFRETVVRIADSEFLQDFLRTRKRAVMDHTFLNRCFRAIRPATWKRLNDLLGQGAVLAEVIEPSTLRMETKLCLVTGPLFAGGRASFSRLLCTKPPPR